jgi:phage major head subunit gpT-like protein
MIANLENLGILTTGVRTAFRDALINARARADWMKVASSVPSSTLTETYPWLSNFPKMEEWIGTRTFKTLSEHQYTLVNKVWQASVELLLQQIEDDQFGAITPQAASAGDSAERFIDELLFGGLFANAFTTGLCYDGTPFIGAAHKGRGTTSNLVPVPAGQDAVDPWFLLDTTMPLKPFFWQERKAPEIEFIGQPFSGPRVERRSVLWSVERRGNAGYGIWQMAVGSQAPLVDDESNPLPAFDAAYALLMGQTDPDTGRKLGLKPSILVVGPSNRAAANACVLRERLANGSSNTNYKIVDVLVTPYLP